MELLKADVASNSSKRLCCWKTMRVTRRSAGHLLCPRPGESVLSILSNISGARSGRRGYTSVSQGNLTIFLLFFSERI